MPLHAPSDAERERILLYGHSTAGKSYAWLGIADMAHKTRSDAKFHVIDTDRAIRREMFGPSAPFAHLRDRVQIHLAQDIVQAQEASEKILPNVNPDDWIIVDMLSNVWDRMSMWWIKNVFDESPVDYFTTVRRSILAAKESGKGDAREFGGQASVDWDYITKTYLSWEFPISIDAPCHVLATAAETEIQERFDPTGEQRARYRNTNFIAPRGQKLTVHRFHTVLRVSATTTLKGTNREATMFKDRGGRESLWAEHGGRGMTITLSQGPKFAMDYLRKMAGWELA